MKKKISVENLDIIESVKTIIAKKKSKKMAKKLITNWQKKVAKQNSAPMLSENCNECLISPK